MSNLQNRCSDLSTLAFSDYFLKVCINFSPELQGNGRVGGREGWVGKGVGREEENPPQVKTQSDQLLTDGPDDATRLKGHHSGQVMPNWYTL